jgi:hypothetical protein
MTTRDQAHTQYFEYARSLGLPLDGDLENDFQGSWNSASLDSKAYSGAQYQKTWAEVWPEAAHNLRQRAAPTSDRVVDSQSALGNALYGSGSGNVSNIPGAPLVSSPYIPATVAPPPVASIVTTGASLRGTDTPAVGPVGLAYPDDPVNYSSMQVGASQGYSTGGTLRSGIYDTPAGALAAAASPAVGGGSDRTMVVVLLAGIAVAAYLLLK